MNRAHLFRYYSTMEKKADDPCAVIVTYFHEGPAFADTLEDIFNQSILTSAFVVSDCGREDESFDQLCNLFSNRFDDRFSACCTISNFGPSECRNLALNEVSDSEFVAFVDGDDRWSPGHLESQLVFFDECPSVDLVSSNSMSIPWFAHGRRKICFLELCIWNPIVLSSVVIKMRGVNARGFKMRFPAHQNYAEDYFAWLELSLYKQIGVSFGSDNVYRNKRISKNGRLSQNIYRILYYCLLNSVRLVHKGRLLGGFILVLSSCLRLFLKIFFRNVPKKSDVN